MAEKVKIQLYNGDCLEVMKTILADSIDLILCDLPYGIVKKLQLDRQSKDAYKWDDILPTGNLFKEYERIIKVSGRIILFSQEPYTTHLRSFKAENIAFAYPMIWIKNCFANYLGCNHSPVSYFEDLNVFHKRYDRKNNPLREYSKKIYEFIGCNKTEINKRLGHRKAEHFFRWDTSQFSMCTEETYNELIREFHIDKCSEYKEYKECKEINDEYTKRNQKVFNLNDKKHKSNVLTYSKESKSYHPTQKPVALLEDLITTYTNENQTVLDNCMGSGSTGVACKNLNRNFIGIELDKKYFEIAKQRIKEV